jgi:hypothetical protein
MHADSVCHSLAHDDGAGRPSESHANAGAWDVHPMNASKGAEHELTRLASHPHRQLERLSGPRGQKASMEPRQ